MRRDRGDVTEFRTRDTGSLRVLLRVLIELGFAALRAEVIRLAVVLALARRFLLVDLHLAHRVGYHRASSIRNWEFGIWNSSSRRRNCRGRPSGRPARPGLKARPYGTEFLNALLNFAAAAQFTTACGVT